MKRFKKTIKKIPLWIYLLIIGIITFYTYDISISADMGWAINSGLNIFNGKGYTDMDGFLILSRGPLFSLMIAWAYWLLGISVWSAFWVIRIFAILNPIIIYFLGKKLFNKWVGFIAGLLILTSYSINYWSYRHVDAIWPFFILLGLFVLLVGLEKKKYKLYVLAGICFGIALLIKEVAIAFLPLPLLLFIFIKQYRNKKNLVGLGFFYIFLLLAIIPWIGYVYVHSGSLSALLGKIGSDVIIETIVPQQFSIIKNYFIGLGQFFYHPSHRFTMHQELVLFPLFILALIFTTVSALRKNKSSIIISSVFLLFSPILSYIGNHDFRFGQAIVFMLLTYLATANFLIKASVYIKKSLIPKLNLKWLNTQNIVVAFAILILGIQTFVGKYANVTFLKRSFALNPHTERSILGDKWGALGKKTGEWIHQNIPTGSKMIVSKGSEGKHVYFYAHGEYPIYLMPVILSDRLKGVTKIQDNLVFLSSFLNYVNPQNKFYAMREDDLLQTIDEQQIEYIIIGKRRNFLTLYFDAHPGFIKVANFDKGKIKIYKIENPTPLETFELLTAQRAIKYLNRLKQEDYSQYQWLKENFFKNIIGWSGQDLENNEKYGTIINVFKIY